MKSKIFYLNIILNIFFGAKEYEKYKNLDPVRFEKLGAKIVFQSGQTAIYRL
jgi:hypothetical protein